jgi:hypothetical protein
MLMGFVTSPQPYIYTYTLFSQRSINLAATTNLKGAYHTQAIHPFAFLLKTLGIQLIKQANI